MTKPHIREVIVVEGRYDVDTIKRAVDASVVRTDGFGVFSDDAKLCLLRRLGAERGLILLTDSDGAGFLIRNRLKSRLNGIAVKQAYIPDIPGKEKRKSVPSRGGLIGVEGMAEDVILRALRQCGATFERNPAEHREEISKTDLYLLGLSGKPNSAGKRAGLLQELNLPERLTANGLLDVLNCLYRREEFLLMYKTGHSCAEE